MATALDNIGREINNANMTLGEIKGLVATLMKKDVGPAKPVQDAGTPKTNQEGLGKLQTLFETYTKDYNAEVQEQKGLLQTIIDTLKEITGLREKKAKENASSPGKGKIVSKEGTVVSKEEKATAKASEELAKEFHKTLGTKGSGWVHDPYCEKVLTQILAVLTTAKGPKRDEKLLQATRVANKKIRQSKKDALPPVPKPRGRKGTATPKPGAAPNPGDPADAAAEKGNKKSKKTQRVIRGTVLRDEKEFLDNLWYIDNAVNTIRKASDAVQNNFMGFDGFSTIVSGIVDEERKFTQEIRAAAYEVAGITKKSQSLQKVYEEIGTSAAQTGMDRGQTQKFYMKALKSGIRDTKVALNITKAQLNTERQIGVEAGTLNETFMSMAHAGRMNNAQIAQMGRGMRDVGRNTGLAGEALAEAIKSSEQFTNNLRKAANLTASAVENIMEISAHAKKLGIANEMQPLMAAMTSTNNLVFEASRGTQALLYQAAGSVGRIDDLMKGTILRSKKGVQDMARGFDNVLKQFGVESLDAVDNLSDEAKMQLNMQLKAAYGIELGDMRSVIETMREAGKGMADRLADINKQRKLNLTTEERAALDEKERALKAGKSLSILTALSEATKGTGEGVEGMNKALAKFEKRKGEFEGDMNAMGQTWASGGDAARQSIQSALDQINVGRKKAGMDAVKIDSSDIEAALKDKDALALVMDRLTKGEQELATANKEQLDPMTEMAGHLRQINDNIRIYTQSMFSKMFNSVIGKLVAIAGVLLSISAGLGLLTSDVYRTFKSITGMFHTITGGRFAKDVAGAAGKTAGASAGAGAAGKAGAAGNASGAAKAPKTFLEKISQRFRIAAKKADRAITGATDSMAKSMAEGSEKLGNAVAKNPGKAFVDMVKGSWEKTYKVTTEATSRVGTAVRGGFRRAGELAVKGGEQLATAGRQLAKLPKLAKDTAMGVKASVQAAGGVTKVATKGLGAMTKGLGTGLGVITKAGGKATGSLLKVAAGMNPLGLAVMAAFAAIDGLTGGLEAGARAGEIFGKAQEDVTLNEEYAAKTAGLLTGILNGLTLGIAGLILPMDKITDAIARFNAKVPILTIALAPLMVSLELIWGVIKGLALGIWEIMKGLWDGVMNIINPVVEGLSDIFTTIGNMFGGISGKAGGLTKAFREMGGIVGIVSGAIKFVGTAIGWIFKAIGAVIGFILKAVLKIVEGFLVVLEPVVEVLSALWDGVMEVGRGIGDIFMGLWDVVKTIGGAIYDLFSPIFSLFGGGEGKGFMEVMKSIGRVLGQVTGVLLKIVLQPLMLVAKIIGGIGKLIQAVVKMFKGDFSGAGELVKSAIGGVIDALLWPFKGIMSFFGDFGQKVVGVFSWIGNVIGTVFGFVAKTIGVFISGLMAVFAPIGEIFSALWAGISEIGKAFYEIFAGIYDVFASIGNAIYETFYGTYIILSETFGSIGSTIYGIFEPILGLFGSSDGSSFFDTVKAVGTVLGQVVGGIMKFVLWPLMLVAKVLSGIGKLIQAVVSVFRGDFSKAGQLLKDAAWGIVEALIYPFKGIAMYFYEFGSQIMGYIVSPFVGIYNVIKWMVDGVVGAFQWLSDVLWGHSIIPDLITGIITWFAKLPGMILGMVGSIVSYFADMVYQIPDMIWGMAEKIIDVALWPFKTILNFFGAGFGDTAVGGVKAVMGFIFDLIVAPFRVLTKIISGIGKVIQAVGAVFRGDFSGAATLVKDAVMGILNTMLLPFKKLGSWLWNNTIGKMAGFGSWLWENTIGKMAGFGSWLYDNTIGQMANLGSWLFDNTIAPMAEFGDWMFDNTIAPMADFGDWLFDNTIGAMGRFGTWLYDNTIGKMGAFGGWLYENTIGRMSSFGSWLYENTIGQMSGFGSWLYDSTIGSMSSFGSWLWDNTIGKMGSFGTWLYDSTIGQMAGFGSWLWENTIGRLKSFGDWLWDTLTTPFTKLMDWIISWIPGGGAVKTGVQAYSATEAENEKRVETEGNSITGGLGRTLGGITSLDLGKTMGGLGETGGAVLDGLGAAGGAVLNAINPFNWFEEGTRKVEQTGVGVLHKDEMVMPAKDVNTLTAKGGGAFEGSGSFLSEIGNSLMGGLGSLFSGPGSIIGGISSMFSGKAPETPTAAAEPEENGFMSSLKDGFSSLFDGRMMSTIGGGIDSLTGTQMGSSLLGEGSLLNDMNKSVGATMGIQPPSAKAIETRMTAQETESSLDSARFLYEMHTLATTGKGLKVRFAQKGESIEQGLDLNKMMIQLASPANNIEGALAEPNLADLPWDEKQLGPKPVIPEAGENALAPPVPATQAAAASLPTAATDAGKELAQRTAATQPAGMEVVSPDLGELTAESSEQTALMAQMVELLQKFVDLAKPKSQVTGSSGGEPGDPASKSVAHSPANYYRAPIGHVAQTAGKAVLNVGSQTT